MKNAAVLTLEMFQGSLTFEAKKHPTNCKFSAVDMTCCFHFLSFSFHIESNINANIADSRINHHIVARIAILVKNKIKKAKNKAKFNPFQANILFLYHLKTPGFLLLSRGHKNGTLTWTRLKSNTKTCLMRNETSLKCIIIDSSTKNLCTSSLRNIYIHARCGYSVLKRLVKLTSFKSFPLQPSGYQDISAIICACCVINFNTLWLGVHQCKISWKLHLSGKAQYLKYWLTVSSAKHQKICSRLNKVCSH